MKEAISLFVIGVIIAIGRFLVSNEKMSFRKIIGRGILGGALGLVAYPALWIISSWLPIPPAGELQIMIGMGCALSAMGTEILEKALEALIFKFTGKDVSNPKAE